MKYEHLEAYESESKTIGDKQSFQKEEPGGFERYQIEDIPTYKDRRKNG